MNDLPYVLFVYETVNWMIHIPLKQPIPRPLDQFCGICCWVIWQSYVCYVRSIPLRKTFLPTSQFYKWIRSPIKGIYIYRPYNSTYEWPCDWGSVYTIWRRGRETCSWIVVPAPASKICSKVDLWFTTDTIRTRGGKRSKSYLTPTSLISEQVFSEESISFSIGS